MNYRTAFVLLALVAVLTVVTGQKRRLMESPGFATDGGTGLGAGQWLRGRTSWYGEPAWVDPYVATRGGGRSAFGILPWGGCGYTNGDGSMPFAQDEATSYSDDNPDWHGSCGRCYEVRCVPGPVLGTGNKPIPLEHLYYFPKFANVTDEQGRSFPGNPTVGENYYTVTCWSNLSSIVVKVVDMCPCYYCPVNEECRYQESCCYKSIDHPKAGFPSMDLSFWAFQKLAHPEYGVIMIDYRPVDCGSHQPVPWTGGISRTLYQDMVGPGWAFFAYKTPPSKKNNFNVTAAGQGLNGGNAACGELLEGGALTFHSRGAGVPGYQPFSGVQTLEFWIRNVDHPGQTPPVRVVLSGDHSKPTNAQPGQLKEPPTDYCNSEVYLSNVSPSQTADGGWMKYDLPFANFNCPNPGVLNKLDFMTTGWTTICVDNVRLL